MAWKFFLPSSTNPAWQQALSTPVKVISLGLTPCSFMRLKKAMASSPRPCVASPQIIALQGMTFLSGILWNTKLALLRHPDLAYMSTSAVPS
ncbi:unnamed protein product [Spirodela intermedia]|nr:unnamed protein product [Spirodela intermedia]